MSGPIPGHETAREAARRLGYDYSWFVVKLKRGDVPGAFYFHGYAVPRDLEREDLLGTDPSPGRPKKTSSGSQK